VAPDLTVGIEQGSRSASADARIVLASVPTIGRAASSRLLRLPPDQFYLIVVDEAHHAVAATYRRVLEHFGLFAEGTKRLLVGFTATPRRGDKQALSEVFEEIAYARSLPEMVREGTSAEFGAGAWPRRSTSPVSACDTATSSRAIWRERSTYRRGISS
jgi:ATP-dependent helicase IRC3